jgi:vacuolar-type H+-ATPase subunit H
MRILELLDEIAAEIENSRKSLFSAKRTIEVDYVLDILAEIKDTIPDDIRQAQEILDNEKKIISEARDKAQNVLSGVDSRINEMIEEHRVTQLAYEKSNRLLDAAEHQAYELRAGANDYAVNVLDDLMSYMKEYMDIIQENKSNFINKKNKDQAEF